MPPIRLDHVPDIRLIACDMDGTLLDNDHAIHDDFWPLVDELHARGILFCPASGRQYYTLLDQFRPIADKMVFIAENGSYVVQHGKELSSDCLDSVSAREMIRVSRTINAGGANIGVVLCGKRSAYIERSDAAFLAQTQPYYLRLEIVDDLLTIEDEFLKVAVFDFESSERNAAPAFAPYRDTLQVVISGQNWLDIMAPQANKGIGIRHIQDALQITPDQTMVFGDFLNDLEMMDHATYSFAMANAHPRLKERANYLAPGNTDNGVVRTIKSVLGIDR